MAGVTLHLDEQLAQEDAGGLARGDAAGAHAGQGQQGVVGERGLERRHERGVRDAVVAFEGRPPDEALPPEEQPPGQRRPAAEAVEQPRVVDQMHGGGHETRRFQRLPALGLAADRGQLDELGLAPCFVPPRQAGVRGPEIQGPARHGRRRSSVNSARSSAPVASA